MLSNNTTKRISDKRYPFLLICTFVPMKSKEEILKSCYTPGADGMPEIKADDLLKAMEQYSEQAFNAARLQTGSSVSFTSYAEYKASLEFAPPEPGEADNIQFIADSIMEQFVPYDKNVQEFSFDFKSSGNSYRVAYQKSSQGYWEFVKYDYTD
jgi:hypothetical protein